MDNAMLERIQTDGNPPKATNASVTTRAELAVAPAPVQTEMRERPVVAPTNAHQSALEMDRVRAVFNVLGAVRKEADNIASFEENDRRLEEIYARIFPSRKGAAENAQIEVSAAGKKEAAEVEKLFAEAFGHDFEESVIAAGDAADWLLLRERKLIENRIELALDRILILRGKLSIDREASYDRLLGVSVSVAGLNLARAQLGDSEFGIGNASSALDSIMSNLRSMVSAHKNISHEYVRLIVGS